MQFVMQFTTDNAEFDGDIRVIECAIAQTLRRIANYVEHDAINTGTIRDTNGNIIGAYALTPTAKTE